ncbi:MAG: V-type ATP synthase subunit I [archaeon]
MITPKRLSKVTIIGPQRFMYKIINRIHELGCMHLIDYIKKDGDDVFDIGSPFEGNETISEELVKLRSIMSYLKINSSDETQYTTTEKNPHQRVESLFEEVTDIQEKSEYANKLIFALKKEKQQLALKSISLEIPAKLNDSSHVYMIGYSTNIEEKDMNLISNKAYVIKEKFEGIDLIAVFVNKQKANAVWEILSKYNFIEIEKPYIKAAVKNLKAVSFLKFVKLGSSLEKGAAIKKQMASKLLSLKKENMEFLTSYEKHLRYKAEVSESPLRLATAKNSFAISGWVADSDLENLKSSLEKTAENKVYMTVEKPKKGDKAPIALDNLKYAKPFEFFMNMYTLPSYNEIDPTPILFYTFPLFFGFMLGDIGYGIVTLFLFMLLKKKIPQAKAILNAFIVASISTILFGVLFGEVFGAEEFIISGHEIKLWHILSRSHQVTDLLALSVLIGLIHITIGYIIGFINVLRQHGLKHAVMEKCGWILLLPMFIFLLKLFGILNSTYTNFMSIFIFPFPVLIGLSIVGIVLIIVGEGVKGALEIPNLLSNILSYGRLMAVGLASVSLAVVINELAGKMFASGIFGIIFGIIILILGHTINIALGILSPFLHALRLHYVEFFTKFFHGGGIKFKSFGENKE